MRLFLTIFLSLASIIVSAQSKDTLIRYFNVAFEPCKKKEASFVGILIRMGGSWNTVVFDSAKHIVMRGNYLDTDARIKNGYFTYYTEKGNRFLGGEFRENQRNGLWQTWYPSGKPKDSVHYVADQVTGPCSIHYENGIKEVSGEYVQGALTGKWLWYHENGQLASEEIWKNGVLEDIHCYDTLGRSQGMNCAVSKLPTLKGQFGGIEKCLMDSLRYPKEAMNKGLEGFVAISFTIKKTGKLEDLKILFSTDNVFTAEVQRVLRSLPDWYPAVSHNRTLDHTMGFRIPFPTDNILPLALPEQLSSDGFLK